MCKVIVIENSNIRQTLHCELEVLERSRIALHQLFRWHIVAPFRDTHRYPLLRHVCARDSNKTKDHLVRRSFRLFQKEDLISNRVREYRLEDKTLTLPQHLPTQVICRLGSGIGV